MCFLDEYDWLYDIIRCTKKYMRMPITVGESASCKIENYSKLKHFRSPKKCETLSLSQYQSIGYIRPDRIPSLASKKASILILWRDLYLEHTQVVKNLLGLNKALHSKYQLNRRKEAIKYELNDVRIYYQTWAVSPITFT